MLVWSESESTRELPSAYNELLSRDRWVCWRYLDNKKVPHSITVPHRPINALNPKNWHSYTKVVESVLTNQYDGIGFVLNGDGVVGIDIDDCIDNGRINPIANDIMQELGCRLFEISPSGKGLRGFGLGPNLTSGVRGLYRGLSIELYSDKRYLTVTGNAVVAKNLAELTRFEQVAAAVRSSFTEATEVTDATEATEARWGGPTTILNPDSIEFPPSCIPRRFRTRNRCIFTLARFLKAHAPMATPDDLLPVVERWHKEAEPFIRTKHFEESWIDFRVAWVNVTQPYGQTLDKILANLPAPPASLIQPHYGQHIIQLIQICTALQMHFGSAPFFLSCREASNRLGVSHTHANSLLRVLTMDGVISVVKKGEGLNATRYRLRLL